MVLHDSIGMKRHAPSVSYRFLPEAETEYLEVIKFNGDQLPRLGVLVVQFENLSVGSDLPLSTALSWKLVLRT